MKKLFYMLGLMVCFSSCHDMDGTLDESWRRLPEKMTVDTVIDVSEVSYNELALISPDESQLEWMRESGGLLVKTSVEIPNAYTDYEDIVLYYSSGEDALPPYKDQYVSVSGPYDGMVAFWKYDSWLIDKKHPVFYINPDYYASGEEPLGLRMYYKLEASSWYGGLPGFVDDCLTDYGDYAHSYSPVSSYVTQRPATLRYYRVEDFGMYDAGNIRCSFECSVPMNQSFGDTLQVGLCCSQTDDLPGMDDEVYRTELEVYGWENRFPVEFFASVSGSGWYYVRAFVEIDGKVAYSPVQQLFVTGMR